MLNYAVAITINASPDVVWETLTDEATIVEWNGTIDSFSGTIAQGEQVTLCSSFEAEKEMCFDLTVDEYVANDHMVWSSGNFVFNGVRTFTLVDNGDGTTEFLMEEQFAGLFKKSIAKSFDLQPSFDRFAADLKAESEARMPAPEPEPEPEPEEVDVPLDQLPEAVSAAIQERWPDAELKSAELEGETYDVSFATAEGELLEAEVSADGTIGEVEADDDEDDDADDEDGGDDEDDDDDDE